MNAKFLLLGALAMVPVTGSLLGVFGDPATFTTTVNAPTDSTPTATTSGFDLMNINGWRLSLCAPTGTTLAGDGGSMHAYLISNITGQVLRNPDLDKNVTVTSTSCGGNGCQCEVWPDTEQVAQLGGTLYYKATTITVTDQDGGPFNDGGAALQVRISGWRSRK